MAPINTYVVGKLQRGPPNPHIQKSHGADTNLMKFYVTQTSTTYGQNWSHFTPRHGKHVGTGYLSNFRPGVYYSQHLDSLDNPNMGRIVARNYLSVNHRDFRPYEDSDGTDPLPAHVHQVESGFIRQKAINNPTVREVNDVHVDKRALSEITDFLPRHRTKLATIKAKDQVDLENWAHGPSYMSTETHQRFNGLANDRTKLPSGPNEETGFTHAYNIEPITFHPASDYKGDLPGYYTDRPTGVSVTRTTYLPHKLPEGDEILPVLAYGSSRETGFTKGTKALPGLVSRIPSDAYDKATNMRQFRVAALKKKNPSDYMNAIHPDNHSSMTTNFFRGQIWPSATESDRLGRTMAGTQEPSGYVRNDETFVMTADDPSRFITHYDTRFYNKEPYGLNREGRCRGDVIEQLPDGFTRSTALHSYGPDICTTATLRRLYPYVARSIQARDPFYDDHTYDRKVRFNDAVPQAITAS